MITGPVGGEVQWSLPRSTSWTAASQGFTGPEGSQSKYEIPITLSIRYALMKALSDVHIDLFPAFVQPCNRGMLIDVNVPLLECRRKAGKCATVLHK